MSEFEYKELNEDPAGEYPFTQSLLYAAWQRALGRKVIRYGVYDKSGGELVAHFQLVKYPLPFGKSYLYAPYGPVIVSESDGLLDSLREKVSDIEKSERAIFARLDFHPRQSERASFKSVGNNKGSYFQPRVEWRLPLDKSEEELLAGMHKNTRYSIRTSEDRGVKVEIAQSNFDKYFERFYELMQETAKRADFGLHTREYYQAVFDSLPGTGSYLAVAKLGEDIVAIDVVVVFHSTAMYLFGASSTASKHEMPTYLAQWRAILFAKAQGYKYYNFGGISAEGELNKAWEGLTAFKKRFGGEEYWHSPLVDVVGSPFWYYLYNLYKSLR